MTRWQNYYDILSRTTSTNRGNTKLYIKVSLFIAFTNKARSTGEECDGGGFVEKPCNLRNLKPEKDKRSSKLPIGSNHPLQYYSLTTQIIGTKSMHKIFHVSGEGEHWFDELSIWRGFKMKSLTLSCRKKGLHSLEEPTPEVYWAPNIHVCS